MWSPWKTHWALALAKGIREPHKVKKNSFDLGGGQTHDLRIRSTVTLPTELQGRTDLSGSIPTEVKRIFSLPHVVPWFPLLGLMPCGSFTGFTQLKNSLVPLIQVLLFYCFLKGTHFKSTFMYKTVILSTLVNSLIVTTSCKRPPPVTDDFVKTIDIVS